MKVLSLFDGISCGQLALQKAGIFYDSYSASEIDEYVIKITQKNFPNTLQVGDICNLRGSDLPKIDLLIGGSPCQGFSFAGKRLNFDDPRSKLFFEYVRILEEVKPKWFLLENSIMKQEWADIISAYLKISYVKINSSLVSAQQRNRYYWTNIPIVLEDDRNLVLADIVDYTVMPTKSYFVDPVKYSFSREKARNILRIGSMKNDNKYPSQGHRVYSLQGVSPALMSNSGGGPRAPHIAFDDKLCREANILECERLQTLPDGYTEGISVTRRHHAIGNAWTVDIVAQIFRGLLNENNN